MMGKLEWSSMNENVRSAIRKAFLSGKVIWQSEDCDLPADLIHIGWHSWNGKRQPVWEVDGFLYVGVAEW